MRYWFRGLPALGIVSSADTGSMGYWFQGLPDNWAPGGSAALITGTAVLGFSGISFNASGRRTETATANLAFQGISFNGVGSIAHKGTGNLAFRGISLTASGFDAGVPGGLRQFWVC